MQPARQQANPTLPTSLSLPGKGGFSASLWGFCRPEGSPAKAPHAGSLPCVERGCCSLPSARRPTGLVRTPAGILDAQHLTRLARDAHIWRLSAEISHPEGARGRGPGLPNPQRASRATLGWRCGRRGRSVTTARLEAVPLGGTGAQSFRRRWPRAISSGVPRVPLAEGAAAVPPSFRVKCPGLHSHGAGGGLGWIFQRF